MILFLELFKMPFKVFKTNKLRTILTMIGIIVGVASIIVVSSISDATQLNIKKNLEKINDTPVNFQIFPEYDNNGNQKKVDMSFLYEYAKNAKDIYAISAIGETNWQELSFKIQDAQSRALSSDSEQMNEAGITAENMYLEESESLESRDEKIKLIDADYFKIYQKKLLAGRYFSLYEQEHSMPVALIKKSTASTMGLNDALGKVIRVNAQPVRIIGVLADNNEIDTSSARYVNGLYMLNSYQQQYGVKNELTYQFIMKTNKGTDKNEVVTSLKKNAEKYIKRNQFVVDMYSDNNDSTSQMMDMLEFSFMGIGLLSLFIGGVGIMNIMLVSVNERVKEIGIRCALGAHKSHIIIQFLIESVIITLIAGALGVILALGGLLIANQQLEELTLHINWFKAFGSVLICSSIGIVFGYYPANKAANLKIADALRNE